MKKHILSPAGRKDLFSGFTLFVALACLLNLVMNLINHRFHPGDFQVYYGAASGLAAGDPVYGVSYYTGSGFYKYSPVTLLFFLPYLPFGLKAASVIHFVLLSAAYGFTFLTIRDLLRDYFPALRTRRQQGLLAFSFACILIHLTRELYLGNINILLLWLCCLSFRKFLEERDRSGGILAAIAILAKPYLVILLLPLALRGRWRALSLVAATLAAGLLLPFLYPGPARAIALYSGWFQTMGQHGADYPGMTSVDYLVRQIFPAWPGWGIYLVFLFILSIVSASILHHRRSGRKGGDGLQKRDLAFEWFLLCALLPNLIKTDWVLLQFSAPLITFMVFTIAARKSYGWIPLLAALLFFYGANSDDLLGRELSRNILHSGLMGLANFLLVIAGAVMYRNIR